MPVLSVRARTTRRFQLRPFRRRDLDVLSEAVVRSLPELHEWLPWAHLGYGRRDALIYLRDSAKAWEEGRAFDLAVFTHGDPRRQLGSVSVWFRGRQAAAGEIGYWVRSDETGKGIATEVTARVLQIGFEELEMHRVALRIAVGNRSSERVAEKIGFVREGLLREELLVRGEWLDHSLWSMLESEYRAARLRFVENGWLEGSS